MTEITIVGLDLAKRVFQLHGATADGGVAIRKKLSRGQVLAIFADMPPCVVAMEACATAHYWVRIPEHPPTHSDNMRPPIPGYPPTCDALP